MGCTLTFAKHSMPPRKKRKHDFSKNDWKARVNMLLIFNIWIKDLLLYRGEEQRLKGTSKGMAKIKEVAIKWL